MGRLGEGELTVWAEDIECAETWRQECIYAQSLSSCPTLCDSAHFSPPNFSVHGVLQARILEGLPCPPPGDLPNPGIEPKSLAMQADSLPLIHWTSLEARIYTSIYEHCKCLKMTGTELTRQRSNKTNHQRPLSRVNTFDCLKERPDQS